MTQHNGSMAVDTHGKPIRFDPKQPGQIDPRDLFVAIRRVLPETVKAKIMHTRDQHDRLQWIVGDLFNEIYVCVKANAIEATRADVSIFTLYELGMEDERSYSSVLIDAATAAFYPVEARKEFAVLPFSHFRFAASFGDQYRGVLDMAMRFMGQYNRPPSAKWLKAQYNVALAGIDEQANEPGAPLAPAAMAEISGDFGHRADVAPTPPDGERVEKIRYHLQALQSEVNALPGTLGPLVAQIILLLQQVLENMP